MTFIYNYHPVSGEHLNQSKASNDPLEGKPLLPAFATDKRPPSVNVNQCAVFVDGTWAIVADFRGKEYFLKDGSQHTIEKLGDELPEDALNEAPSPSLDKLKANAIVDVKKLATEIRAKITGYADANEVAGWLKKVPRAQRIIDNEASEKDISILQAECDERGKGESPLALAEIQLKKSERFDEAIAVIDGMQSGALSAIQSKRNENTLAELLEELQAKANQKIQALLGSG